MKDIGTGKHHGAGGVEAAPMSAVRAARPWEDIMEEMEEMNDSQTDSEGLPAPQPRALGAATAAASEARNVRAVCQFCESFVRTIFRHRYRLLYRSSRKRVLR